MQSAAGQDLALTYRTLSEDERELMAAFQRWYLTLYTISINSGIKRCFGTSENGYLIIILTIYSICTTLEGNKHQIIL